MSRDDRALMSWIWWAYTGFDPTIITAVASGIFEFGRHAWSSEVRVKLVGGGTNGALGTQDIVVRVLQNVDADRIIRAPY